MSLPELKKEIESLKKMTEEILSLLKNESEGTSSSNDLEPIAAKIIKEIKDEIKQCNCNKEILDALKIPNGKEVQTSEPESQQTPNYGGLTKYSYPNYWVGNAELGSSGNPKALKWPFTETTKE